MKYLHPLLTNTHVITHNIMKFTFRISMTNFQLTEAMEKEKKKKVKVTGT
jgi:hypothetical protein